MTDYFQARSIVKDLFDDNRFQTLSNQSFTVYNIPIEVSLKRGANA